MRIFYAIISFIFWLFSLMPWWFLGLVSHLLRFVVFTLFGYRKKVIERNIQNSFPKKSKKEKKEIQRKFELHLTDLLIETIKCKSISRKAIQKHVELDISNLIDEFNASESGAVVVMGHYGNWEMACLRFSLDYSENIKVIYHPLHNPFFDEYMINQRTRFGGELYPMQQVLRKMIQNKNKRTFTIFLGDQTPSPEHCHWMTFLNQETPIFLGTEKMARKLNMPVIYARINKVKRFHYKITADVICRNPSQMKENEITEIHTRYLEKDIHDQPFNWLWSHKRWKHTRPK